MARGGAPQWLAGVVAGIAGGLHADGPPSLQVLALSGYYAER